MPGHNTQHVSGTSSKKVRSSGISHYAGLLGFMALALGACASPVPTDSRALFERLLETFRSPSPDRAHHLFPNPVGVAELCPDHPEVGERFVNQYLEARKSFKRCANLDWAGVGDLRVQRTDEDKAVPGCGGRMIELDDVVAIVNTHDSTYKIEIDDPVSLPGLVLLSKDVSCRPINRDCREAMENVVDIRGMKSDDHTLDEEIIGRTLNCHSTWSASSGRVLKLNVETIACLKEADNEDGLLNCESVASKGPVFPPSCVRLFKIIDGCKADNSEELGDGFANLPQIAKENWNDITDDVLLGAFCDQELATIRPVLGACPKTLKAETSPFLPLDPEASKKEWNIKSVSARVVSDLEPIAARREEEANPRVEVTPENIDSLANAASPTRDLTALARPRASSSLPDWNGHSYNIANLTDGKLETSWQPKKKSGVGEWFALDFDEEFEFTALEIANGFQSTFEQYDLYTANARMRRITVTIGDKSSTFEFPDNRGYVPVPIDPPARGRRIIVTIESSYPGTEWQDLAVSDLRVKGR